MTVMPSLRLSETDAEDIASYLITLRKKSPSDYADASFMDDPQLKEQGKKWVRFLGCFGCHELSGLEDEGRIGTELTAEGSKPVERLDFALLTEVAERGGNEPIKDPEDLARLPEGPAKEPWYDHQGFFEQDRKSTRLNSSHGYISYAVFCLKKKKPQYTHLPALHTRW